MDESASQLRARVLESIEARAARFPRPFGIVAGWTGPRGSFVVAAGARGGGDARPIDARGLFAIGSVTKVFTTSLLAEMVERGEVSLDQPVQCLMPAGVTLPTRAGRPITLEQLATHSSGLPAFPDDMRPNDGVRPHVEYRLEQLYAYLARCELPALPAGSARYSNLGIGLLAHALSLRAGLDFEALLRARILSVLGMERTHLRVPALLREHVMPGNNPLGGPVLSWESQTLAGCGPLYASASDLLRFLAAHVGLVRTPLSAALQRSHALRGPALDPDTHMALGWMRPLRLRGDVRMHTGLSGGYRALLGFERARRCGVVVLCNAIHPIADIGLHLLDPSQPLRPPPGDPRAITLPAAALAAYAGNYRVEGSAPLQVRLRGDALRVATPLGEGPVLPAGDDTFFFPDTGWSLRFHRDPRGQVHSLVLHADDAVVPAQRVPTP